jgi:hypothetical protein
VGAGGAEHFEELLAQLVASVVFGEAAQLAANADGVLEQTIYVSQHLRSFDGVGRGAAPSWS